MPSTRQGHSITRPSLVFPSLALRPSFWRTFSRTSPMPSPIHVSNWGDRMSALTSAKAQKISIPVLRPVFMIGLLIVAFWIFVALTIDFWAPYDPLKIVGRKLLEPSLQHWLGTDALGR